MPNSIRKIVSGGQTGADRAALDFALERGLDTGGHVPKGRIAEDGPISAKYPNLTETSTEHVEERTKLNILNSDATLILSHGDLAGGSLLTRTYARQLGKPFLAVDLAALTIDEAVIDISGWLEENSPATINIAGPRSSEDPEIYSATIDLLRVLFQDLSH